MRYHNRVLLSLGSNRHNREYNLIKAVTILKKNVTSIKKSSIYLSSPVDYKKQNNFLNMTIIGSTRLAPLALLHFLKQIEKKMGRVKTVAQGPRIIDIDIIFFNKLEVKSPDLILPHAAYYNRLFVLIPLLEIAPAWVDLVKNKKVQTIKEQNCFNGQYLHLYKTR